MDKIIDVAQYVFEEYKHITGETIDEMKLHNCSILHNVSRWLLQTRHFLKGNLKGGNMVLCAKISVTPLHQMA